MNKASYRVTYRHEPRGILWLVWFVMMPTCIWIWKFSYEWLLSKANDDALSHSVFISVVGFFLIGRIIHSVFCFFYNAYIDAIENQKRPEFGALVVSVFALIVSLFAYFQK